jgi:hypothetical protein
MHCVVGFAWRTQRSPLALIFGPRYYDFRAMMPESITIPCFSTLHDLTRGLENWQS